jgi:hypothetical protein
MKIDMTNSIMFGLYQRTKLILKHNIGITKEVEIFKLFMDLLFNLSISNLD